MTPDEHAAEALRLVRRSEGLSAADATNEIARAQVHATLSLRPAPPARQPGFLPRRGFVPRGEVMSGHDLHEQINDIGDEFAGRDDYSGGALGEAVLDGWDDDDLPDPS